MKPKKDNTSIVSLCFTFRLREFTTRIYNYNVLLPSDVCWFITRFDYFDLVYNIYIYICVCIIYNYYICIVMPGKLGMMFSSDFVHWGTTLRAPKDAVLYWGANASCKGQWRCLRCWRLLVAMGVMEFHGRNMGQIRWKYGENGDGIWWMEVDMKKHMNPNQWIWHLETYGYC